MAFTLRVGENGRVLGGSVPVYRCRIGTQDQRIVERDLRAADRTSLTAVVEARGQVLLEARRQFRWSEADPPDPDEVALALTQLASLLRGGVGLAESLSAVGGATANSILRRAFTETGARIRSGASIASAFEAEPDVFDPLLVAATHGAADAAALATVLARRSTSLSETAELSRRVRSAAAYPALLLGASGLVLTFVVGHVVPSIGRLFEESGTPMPLATRIAVAIGTVLAENATWGVPLLIGLAAVAVGLVRSVRGASFFDAIMRRLPLVGVAWAAQPWTQWAFTVSEGVRASVPLPVALKLGAATVTRPNLAPGMIRVANDVERGLSLSQALTRSGLLCPPLVASAVAVDVRGTDLAELLAGAARAESARITWALGRLARLVEPLLVVGVGIVIGAIVISLYLPILSLVDTL